MFSFPPTADCLPRHYNKQACITCRANKIRCYPAAPHSTACARCASRRIRCEFPLPRKRGPKGQLKLIEQPNHNVLATASLFETCFRHPMYQMLPIIHEQDFTLRLRKKNVPDYLLSAFMLLALRSVNFKGDLSRLQSYVSGTLQRQAPSEDALRAHLLHALSCVLARDVRAMYVASGVATRMAWLLKLNKIDQEEQEDDITLESRRRLWWCCFLFDHTSSVISGLGLQIDMDDVHVRYPNESRVWQNQHSFVAESPLFDMNELFGDLSAYELTHVSVETKPLILFIQLMVIGQHISEFVKHGHINCRCSNCQQLGLTRFLKLQETFDQLNCALNRWSGAFIKVRLECKDPNLNSLQYLDGLYNCLLVILHRPQLTWMRHVSVMTPAQRQHFEQVLQAGKLILLNTVFSTMDTDAFPCLNFYVLTAGILFVDIIQAPCVPYEDKLSAMEYLEQCRNYLNVETAKYPMNRYEFTGRKNFGEMLESIVHKKLAQLDLLPRASSPVSDVVY